MTDPRLMPLAETFSTELAEIDAFSKHWRSVALHSVLPGLKRISTIESVGSSTRIEGAKLDDVQVATLLAQLEVTHFISRDEQEVAGYAHTLELVFDSWSSIPLSEGHVCQLHETLLAHSTKDERHRGRYKSLPNHVVAFDETGQEIGVIFETAEPYRTPFMMQELFERTAKGLSTSAQHPLLTIGAFVVEFLAIHPFQDGNGRLSRVLTTLLLLRAGYDHVPYASLEQIVEERKGEYYQALRATQATLGTGRVDLIPWLTFFLHMLVEHKERLARRLRSPAQETGSPQDAGPPDEGAPNRVHERAQHPLSDAVLDQLAAHGKRSMRELIEGTGANRSTLKLRLGELVASGRITRHGRGRGTWYTT